MKAVAWESIFLILVIAFSLLSTLIVIQKFIKEGKETVSQFSCSNKIQKYCSELISGKNPDWNSIPPKKGCEKYGIKSPPSKEECEEVFK